MTAADLLPEFDHEMASTRTMLERLPDGSLDFKPHERSWGLLELGSHVGNIPNWAATILTTRELDLAQPFDREEPTSREEILSGFDGAVAAGREALEGAADSDFQMPWTLRSGDHEIFTMPKGACLRSFVMNHLIHHRAQLGVYLRLLDVPVPGMYGPSADEGQ